ncbi:MAG: response regulator [Polyangiaceae bacterium]|nr:response regulator [Polyangiaceae bacterium]
MNQRDGTASSTSLPPALLPSPDGSAAPGEPGASADASNEASRVRILLIEDDPICQEATASVLAKRGYSLMRAETGQAGLSALESAQIDLVIADLGLPDMPYASLLEGIRRRVPDAPVIVLSGETRSAAMLDAIHRGASDFVSKGEHPRLLEAAVGRVVERMRLTRENEALVRQLLRVASELEEQVAERTGALEEANRRLTQEMAERQRVEGELRLAQKLEAVGQLAAGIAHEINTPAQFVGDSVHFIAESFQDTLKLVAKYRDVMRTLAALPEHAELAQGMQEVEEQADVDYVIEHLPGALERALDGIARIASIVGAMKEFAHPDQKEKSAADLNRSISATLTIARNEYKYVADVETDFGELPPVMCHLGDINQVLLNLLVNAAHAIADVMTATGQRGTIRVRTRYEPPMARIEIEDTGCGIPERIRARVFDPFFTTKEVGRGSGQGLAIARSIVVDKHHGSLTFETEVGRGTTFTIRIPVDGRAPEPMGSERASSDGLGR